ncbi:MAG: peptidase M48 [Candidatus Dadabacteria bacterium]|nr:MAG: peptidase M48 [Candidatus Dadabacteria bacterium]
MLVTGKKGVRRIVLKTFFALPLLLLPAGCGGFSFQAIGTALLQEVGVLPGKSVFDSAKGLLNATRDLTREEEYYLGRAVSAHILTIYPLYEKPELTAYVNKVGLTVASESGLPETFGGYHFAVLDSDEINAMAAPGGFIFISRGILELMPDEDSLAAVLAHEVMHVAKKHGVAAISQDNMTRTLSALGTFAGSLNCSELIQQATTVFGGAVKDITDTLVTSGYSRTQEREADLGAVDILYRAGYDPYAMEVMLQLVEGQSGKSSGGWFDTHPPASERLKMVRNYLEKKNIPHISAGKDKRRERFLRHVGSVSLAGAARSGRSL